MKRWLYLNLAFLCLAPLWIARAAPPLTMRELAGTYTDGDDLLPPGERLTLKPSGEFDFEMFGCLPSARAEQPAKDQAILRDGVLTFKKFHPEIGGDGKPLPDTYYPVRWGRRIYMVRTDMMDFFCDDVNGGDEPRKKERGSVFMLKRGHWNRRVTGLPEVPAAYRGRLFAKPLVGKITRTSKAGLRAEVNLGRMDGVWFGMTVYTHVDLGAQSGPWMAKVSRVKEHSCLLVNDTKQIPLQTRQPVSSRPVP